MPAITITDLDNAQLDCAHIGEVATSPNPTATDRLGHVKRTIAGAIAAITLANDRGAWVTATAYAIKDVVQSGGTWYICIVAHTSGATFAGDQATKWRIYQGITTAELGASTGATIVGYGAGTVQDDLDAARPIARGGTGATTAGGAISNLGLIDVNATVVITTSTTLSSSSLGRAFVLTDSGTPANYGVTLPSGSANGSIMYFRVSNAATRIYSLVGSDCTIDGQASQVMWAGESVMLVRESAGWTKLERTNRPLVGHLVIAANQTLAPGATFVPVDFTANGADFSFLDLCFDPVNGRFLSPRRTNWRLSAYVSIAATCTAAGSSEVALAVNGIAPTISPSSLMYTPYAVGQARQTVAMPSGMYSLNAGSYVELIARLNAGTFSASAFEATATNRVTLSYEEVPTW